MQTWRCKRFSTVVVPMCAATSMFKNVHWSLSSPVTLISLFLFLVSQKVWTSHRNCICCLLRRLCHLPVLIHVWSPFPMFINSRPSSSISCKYCLLSPPSVLSIHRGHGAFCWTEVLWCDGVHQFLSFLVWSFKKSSPTFRLARYCFTFYFIYLLWSFIYTWLR